LHSPRPVGAEVVGLAERQRHGIVARVDDAGHLGEAGERGRPQPPCARDQLEAPVPRAHVQRLQHAVAGDRGRERREIVRVGGRARLDVTHGDGPHLRNRGTRGQLVHVVRAVPHPVAGGKAFAGRRRVGVGIGVEVVVVVVERRTGSGHKGGVGRRGSRSGTR
jgi:hypothetical protein